MMWLLSTDQPWGGCWSHVYCTSRDGSVLQTPNARKEKGEGILRWSLPRFGSKLPWKQILSFPFDASHPSDLLDFFEGQHSFSTGSVYKEYCEAMSDPSLKITELLVISSGLERMCFRRFFHDNSSMMRCNYYPPCGEPSLTLGTRPHYDPTSLTILHQDHAGGLQVFAAGKWCLAPPRPGAFVIIIGDTFMALTNGKYKSCLHRAIVNKQSDKKSMAFLLSPNKEKISRPPQGLICGDGRRLCPDGPVRVQSKALQR